MQHTRQTVQFGQVTRQTWRLAIALLLTGCAAQSVTAPEPLGDRAAQAPLQATEAVASAPTPEPQPTVAPDAPVAQRAMMYFVTSGT